MFADTHENIKIMKEIDSRETLSLLAFVEYMYKIIYHNLPEITTRKKKKCTSTKGEKRDRKE